jgi:hypothetical protein
MNRMIMMSRLAFLAVLLPSIAVSGNMMVVAAGDADERWGAHVFQRNARRLLRWHRHRA